VVTFLRTLPFIDAELPNYRCTTVISFSFSCRRNSIGWGQDIEELHISCTVSFIHAALCIISSSSSSSVSNACSHLRTDQDILNAQRGVEDTWLSANKGNVDVLRVVHAWLRKAPCSQRRPLKHIRYIGIRSLWHWYAVVHATVYWCHLVHASRSAHGEAARYCCSSSPGDAALDKWNSLQRFTSHIGLYIGDIFWRWRLLWTFILLARGSHDLFDLCLKDKCRMEDGFPDFLALSFRFYRVFYRVFFTVCAF